MGAFDWAKHLHKPTTTALLLLSTLVRDALVEGPIDDLPLPLNPSVTYCRDVRVGFLGHAQLSSNDAGNRSPLGSM